MPSVFLYEYLTGGGLWSEGPGADVSSLAIEGRAMIAALAADFCALADVHVTLCHDPRTARPELDRRIVWQEVGSRDDERQAIERRARSADWTVVIAPESDGRLVERSEWVDEVGGRRLGPSIEFIRLAADKNRTASRLQAANVPIASGGPYPPCRLQRHEWPAVFKPADGAGSTGVRLVSSVAELEDAGGPWRLEAFRPGQPVSVSALCGPATTRYLPACRQQLSEDGRFQYLGGRLPLDEFSNDRAQRLARRALDAMPPSRGMVGVDLILGEDDESDCVIEINPRLTTSYVGLRQLATTNLARAMLDMAGGLECELLFGREQVQFWADGRASRPKNGMQPMD